MGALKIVLFDILPEKLKLVRDLGFENVFDSRETDAVEVVNGLTGGRGVHVAIEAAGVPPTLLAALRVTRRAGRVVMLGNPSADVTLPASLISQIMRREVDLFGTWNSDYSMRGDDDDWRTTLEAMSAGTLDLKPLITHRVPLEKGIDALEMMRTQTEFFAKVLIHPNGKP